MLYDKGLLNDHLLLLTSMLEPEMEGEVRALLNDVKISEFDNLMTLMYYPPLLSTSTHCHSTTAMSSVDSAVLAHILAQLESLQRLQQILRAKVRPS